MRRLLAAALAFAAPAAAQTAQVAVLGVASETDSVTLGQPFRAGVLLRAPGAAAVDLVAGEAERAYQLVDSARAYPAAPPATHRVVATLVVWVVDPPPTARAEARVTLADGRVLRLPVELPLPPVRAVLPPDSAAPRGPKDVVAIQGSAPFPWWWIAIGGAVLLLAAVLWLRRRRRHSPAPRVDPRERTLAELDALRAAGLVERGAMDEYYARLSRIVRDFAAPEVGTDLTTTEAVERLRRTGAPPESVDRLAALLGGADLAKFARNAPPAAQAEEDWETARAWVAREPRPEVVA